MCACIVCEYACINASTHICTYIHIYIYIYIDKNYFKDKRLILQNKETRCVYHNQLDPLIIESHLHQYCGFMVAQVLC